MYKLNLDTEGYLLSIDHRPDGVEAGEPAIDTLAGLDLEGDRISAHRWDGQRLVLDEARLADVTAAEDMETDAEEVKMLEEALSDTDGTVLEALEGLFAATTATEFISALVKGAKAIRDILEARAMWRARIRELTENLINDAEAAEILSTAGTGGDTDVH